MVGVLALLLLHLKLLIPLLHPLLVLFAAFQDQELLIDRIVEVRIRRSSGFQLVTTRDSQILIRNVERDLMDHHTPRSAAIALLSEALVNRCHDRRCDLGVAEEVDQVAFDLLLWWADPEPLDDIQHLNDINYGHAVGDEAEAWTEFEGPAQNIFQRLLVHVFQHPDFWDCCLGSKLVARFGADTDQLVLVVKTDEGVVVAIIGVVPHANLAHELGVELGGAHSRCRGLSWLDGKGSWAM